LKLEPGDLDALQLRGQLLFARWSLQLDDKAVADRLLERARADLEEVTKKDRTRTLAWVSLSNVYAQSHDLQSSYLAAQRAYEEDAYFSGVESTIRQLFNTAHDLEEFAQAIRWCRDVGARRFPNNWQFVGCQLVMRGTGQINTDADSAWKELGTLETLLPANIKELEVRRHKMFVAATLAQLGMKDSARRVMESARTSDKKIDPNGNLLTYEAMNRLRLGTPEDTTEAFRLLKDYVVSQPLHGKGFLETSHWRGGG
jgi:hypothetical protein